jgi:hypothetical protein
MACSMCGKICLYFVIMIYSECSSQTARIGRLMLESRSRVLVGHNMRISMRSSVGS